MYIAEALQIIAEQEETKDQYDMANVIGVSQGTISNYKKNGAYPTLNVAAKIYKDYGIQCEPFTEHALEDYIEKYMS